MHDNMKSGNNVICGDWQPERSQKLHHNIKPGNVPFQDQSVVTANMMPGNVLFQESVVIASVKPGNVPC